MLTFWELKIWCALLRSEQIFLDHPFHIECPQHFHKQGWEHPSHELVSWPLKHALSVYFCRITHTKTCLPAPPCNLGNTWGQVETHGSMSGSCQRVYTGSVCVLCLNGSRRIVRCVQFQTIVGQVYHSFFYSSIHLFLHLSLFSHPLHLCVLILKKTTLVWSL